MADQQGMEAVSGMALGLGMDFGDQGTGGVDKDHRPPRRLGWHRLGHAMGGEHHWPVVRAGVKLLNEDGAHGFKAAHDMGVMDNLVAHIDRRTPFRQRLFDDLDRPVDPGAEPPRRGQPDPERRAARGGGQGRGPIWQDLLWQNSALFQVWRAALRVSVFRGYHAPATDRIAPAHGRDVGSQAHFPPSGVSRVKVYQLARLAGVTAILAGTLLGISACTFGKQLDSRPNVGPCPVPGALYDVARLVEVGQPERHENVGFTGEIEGVRGYCRYVGKEPITMQLEIDFAFGRGPKAEGDAKTYTYFVSATRRDRNVLAKEDYSVNVKFPKGASVVRRTEKVDGIIIPRATGTVSGTNFEIITGFELTPDQLAYNRSGKRFTMEVKKPAGAPARH